jgi:hypothetical protein
VESPPWARAPLVVLVPLIRMMLSKRLDRIMGVRVS